MATCTICRHPKREEIDRALSTPGRSIRGTSAAFAVSEDALCRHRKHAVGVVEARKATSLRTLADFIATLEKLHARGVAGIEKAEKMRNLTASANFMREVRQTTELIGKFVGELKDGPSVNLILAPEWHAVRAAILEALAGHPEARAAVSAALLRREVSLSPASALTLPHGGTTDIPLTARALPEAGAAACLPRATGASGAVVSEAVGEVEPPHDRQTAANVAKGGGAVTDPPVGGGE